MRFDRDPFCSWLRPVKDGGFCGVLGVCCSSVCIVRWSAVVGISRKRCDDVGRGMKCRLCRALILKHTTERGG